MKLEKGVVANGVVGLWLTLTLTRRQQDKGVVALETATVGEGRGCVRTGV